MINLFCPRCQHVLTHIDGSYFCDNCPTSYQTVNSIPNLDYLQSNERLVFDQMYSTQACLSENEIAVAQENGDRLLHLLETNPDHEYEILEIAAGRGELTVGLFLSPQIQNSNIYCFDHSVQSMQILTNTVMQFKNETSNSIYPSIQDVNSMAFQGSSFDLVVGNAALHHFLDFDKIVASCNTLLKPGGKMMFTEPFLSGYLLVARIWTQVYEEKFGLISLLDTGFILNGSLGYLGFIVNDITVRSQRDRIRLENLTDKHLFIESDFQKIADDNKIHVAFYEYSTEASARNLMNELLNTYMILDPDFRKRSLELWNKYVELAGKSFYGLDSYFKTIIFTKPFTSS